MYEHHTEELLPVSKFAARLFVHVLGACAFVGLSLAIGVGGFVWSEHMDPLTAFLQSAMLVGGMGPVDVPETEPGKWFAAFYALYCGLVLVVATGIVGAPVLHRLLHSLHLDDDS